MIDLDWSTYGGPAIHKTEKFNPTEVVIRLIDENASASRDVVERLFIAEIDPPDASPPEDQDRRRPCLKYFFWHAWNGLHPRHVKRRLSKLTPQTPDQRKAQLKKDVQLISHAVIGKLVMPNGKKLADCTGTEMTKFGGFFAKIGKMAGRRKVGAVLSETQLQKLWKDSK